MTEQRPGNGDKPRRLGLLRVPLFRLLAINLAVGATVAALLVGGLLALDPGGLRHLILADRSPAVALGLLLFGFVVTLGSTAMGTAIMAMGQSANDDAPRGPPKLVAHPPPLRAKADPRLIRINSSSRGFPMVRPKEPPMIGITLTTDQIRNAPPQVRQWIEHEVIAALGLAADAPPAAEPNQGAHLIGCTSEEAAAVLTQIHGLIPAFNVFFEFARPGISFGQPPVMAFRLIDILYHTRLQSIDQVVECLEAINAAFARVRHDPAARFCGFDNQGHCLIAPETQRSVAALWQQILASHQAPAAGTPDTNSASSAA